MLVYASARRSYSLWLTVLRPRFHQLAALLQRVASAVGLLSLFGEWLVACSPGKNEVAYLYLGIFHVLGYVPCEWNL